MNTTGALSLSLSLSLSRPHFVSHLFPEGNKTNTVQEPRSQGLFFVVIFRPRAHHRIVYDAFPQFRRKKGSFARFYEPARPNFYPITNFANRQKFPSGYTRDARDAPNRTRYSNRRELR